jgi:hypothetical protein
VGTPPAQRSIEIFACWVFLLVFFQLDEGTLGTNEMGSVTFVFSSLDTKEAKNQEQPTLSVAPIYGCDLWERRLLNVLLIFLHVDFIKYYIEQIIICLKFINLLKRHCEPLAVKQSNCNALL